MTVDNKWNKYQEKWVRKLLSGEYNQVEGTLMSLPNFKKKTVENMGFCCLGLAEYMERPESSFLKLEDNLQGSNYRNSIEAKATPETVKELNLSSPLGDLIEDEYEEDEYLGSLAEMNDGGLSFKIIAKFIIEKPWQVFTNFDRNYDPSTAPDFKLD